MKIKIATVKFLNSIFYNYYFENNKDIFVVKYFYPSQLKEQLLSKKFDAALLPVYEYLCNKNKIKKIYNYGIASNGPVKTVRLYFNKNTDMKNIKTIYLDKNSATSNFLAKFLYKHRKINFILKNKYFLNKTEAKIIIGDRNFKKYKNYQYIDLADEFKKIYKLPFVFAIWVSNKNIGLNQHLKKSINYSKNNIEKILYNTGALKKIKLEEIKKYLLFNIKYKLTDKHKQAIRKFDEQIYKKNI